jgi:hypothetical protein
MGRRKKGSMGRRSYWHFVGRVGLACVVLGALALACESAPDHASTSETRTVVAWQPQPLQGAAQGTIGSDCSHGAATACKSKICLHVSPVHDRGFVCSEQCRKPENCPSGWICGPSTLPGMRERVCVPQSDWDGGTAAVAEPLLSPPETLPQLMTPSQVAVETREAEAIRSRGDDGGIGDRRRDGGTR